MSYLQFQEGPDSPSGKTKSWRVANVADGSNILGLVYWHSPWRKYVFSIVGPSIYDAKCLREIADFTESKTVAHRALKGEPINDKG